MDYSNKGAVMIKLAVTGCQGRMGQRIVILAIQDSDFKIFSLVERPDHPNAHETLNGITMSPDISAIKGCDILIDFTSPDSTIQNLKFCRDHGINMVIGTTGLVPAQMERIKEASKDIAIVFSSNMSIGVNVLFKSVELLAQSTPQEYAVTMTEAHHIHKKDAPSGTAKTLAKIVEDHSSKKVKDIEAIREGEIIGDHEVRFESAEDIITIKHHAKTRDIFAKGALVAAKFLKDKPNGFFSMQDVLGL